MNGLNIGLSHTIERNVTDTNTAESFGSGAVAVLATPYLIAYMEMAAYDAVQPLLDDGDTTVGTVVNMAHLAALPVGGRVTAYAELTAINGRRLMFRVEAKDGNGRVVGNGTHERAIVNKARFMEKANGAIESKG